jgi:hypothetical protein
MMWGGDGIGMEVGEVFVEGEVDVGERGAHGSAHREAEDLVEKVEAEGE